MQLYQCLIWPCLVNARFVEHVLLYLFGQMLAGHTCSVWNRTGLVIGSAESCLELASEG